MRREDAESELRRVLQDQKSITIPKLKTILQSMNISLKGKGQIDPVVNGLKVKIEKMGKEIKALKQENERMAIVIKNHVKRRDR